MENQRNIALYLDGATSRSRRLTGRVRLIWRYRSKARGAGAGTALNREANPNGGATRISPIVCGAVAQPASACRRAGGYGEAAAGCADNTRAPPLRHGAADRLHREAGNIRHL